MNLKEAIEQLRYNKGAILVKSVGEYSRLTTSLESLGYLWDDGEPIDDFCPPVSPGHGLCIVYGNNEDYLAICYVELEDAKFFKYNIVEVDE